MPVKGWIEVDERYCKGCELCVSVCPQDVLGMNWSVYTQRLPSSLSTYGWLHRVRESAQSFARMPRSPCSGRHLSGAHPGRLKRWLMSRELHKGNTAMAEAAVRAGVEAYFGYPITPQTELLEWMSHRMPELGRVFLQAESEIAAINMVYGAACTGARVMTTSSSPGVSLMMEGLSYIAGTEVPMVLIDVMRGGPGLGNIAPSQADYNQIVHGGGHGDYHPIVLAPASVQEAIDLTVKAFDLAEKYRTIAVVLADGCIGQMMEPAELPPMRPLRT